MAEESYREIYLFKKWRVPPIDIVYGSALPITLKFLDYTIPANAMIMVYASVDETTVYQQSATVSGNAVQFTPKYGFFAVGLNKLQIAINGNKITLEIVVNCQRFLAEGNDPTSTPEAVRPLVEEAREILKETKEVAVKTPYVGENGNWYVWDTSTGAFKDSGKPSKGGKGDAFTYADFTAEQLAGLKGPKGDAFTYADFTAEQLAELKGPKGDAFEYSDFTPAQLAALKGDPGTAATVTSTETVYQAGTSGTEAPTGTWSAAVPTVPQGQYLWTRMTTQFNTGEPVTSYSVSRMGIDGSGAVKTVNGKDPDPAGNVHVQAEDITTTAGQSVQAALDAAVGAVKTVNGKAPDGAGEVTLVAADVGARPDTWVPTAAEVGAQPQMEPWKDYILLTDCNNAGAHNAIYRGKNLGSAVTDAQWAAIQAGTFEYLFIGDFWTINDVNWRIAAFDYYYNTGDTACTTHHVVIVPDVLLYNARMNAEATTAGAYVGSEMYTANLAAAKTTINNVFGAGHILSHRQLLSNAITDQYVSAVSWYNSDVDLMTEQNVYGGKLFDSWMAGVNAARIDTIDPAQFPLFAFRKDLISNRNSYWLRNVASSKHFSCVTNSGQADYAKSDVGGGVRPAFCIKG